MSKRQLVATWALVLLAGCGSNSNPGTDAGTPDLGQVDANLPMTCVGEDGTTPCVVTGSVSEPIEADLTCLGARRELAGDVAERTLQLTAFGATLTPIANGTFEVWPTNVVGTDCGSAAGCVTLTSDAVGLATTSLDWSYFAYHVPANAAAATVETFGYNWLPANVGEISDVQATTVALRDTAIPLVRAGFTLDASKGIVAGAVFDCQYHYLHGVTLRVAVAGSYVDFAGTGATDAGLAYRADALLPDLSLRTSDFSGAFAAANLPTGMARVEAYGVRTMGSSVTLLGCEEVSLHAGAVTIVNVGPLRNDYPVGNGCHGVMP